jgi:hypothetical protein
MQQQQQYHLGVLLAGRCGLHGSGERQEPATGGEGWAQALESAAGFCAV